LLASASTWPTSWYLTFFSSSSSKVTVAPNTTLSPDSVVGSITIARLSRSSRSAIVASIWPWRSLAA
jgi:hypothetical protein